MIVIMWGLKFTEVAVNTYRNSDVFKATHVANTILRNNVVLMLFHRQRRWYSIKTRQDWSLVSCMEHNQPTSGQGQDNYTKSDRVATT